MFNTFRGKMYLNSEEVCEKMKYTVELGQDSITFTCIHLTDAFIQSNLQLRNTISDTL